MAPLVYMALLRSAVLFFYSRILRIKVSGFRGFLSGALFLEFFVWENSPQQNVASLTLYNGAFNFY